MITENIPERFLRQLWKNSYFSTEKLRTTDNQPIEIVSSGTFNHDGGPDFSDAVLRIGTVLHRGDVEIHQHNEEWFQHQHHKDAKYNSVILHVILYGDPPLRALLTQSKRSIPILVLDQFLLPPFRATWQKMILDERAERLATIPCATSNDSIDSTLLHNWLKKLAIERMELKVRRFEERLKEMIGEQQLKTHEPPSRYGEVPFGLHPDELPPPTLHFSTTEFRSLQLWEQLLYEGIMEALGYSKNQGPFLKLAQNVSLQFLSGAVENIPGIERHNRIASILFAVAGLFPTRGEMLDDESKRYIRRLKEHWKDIHSSYHNEMLYRSEWQFFRLRPENFPTIRIAGAAQIIQQFFQHEILKSIIHTSKDRTCATEKKLSLLKQMVIVAADGFWQHHYRFGEESQKKIIRLIGNNRAHDILLNVVIPVCMLYARVFKERDVRESILEIFEKCSAGTKNSIAKMIDEQLLKGKIGIDTAMLQQGALQLYKFYCMERRCGECAVGAAIPFSTKE